MRTALKPVHLDPRAVFNWYNWGTNRLNGQDQGSMAGWEGLSPQGSLQEQTASPGLFWEQLPSSQKREVPKGWQGGKARGLTLYWSKYRFPRGEGNERREVKAINLPCPLRQVNGRKRGQQPCTPRSIFHRKDDNDWTCHSPKPETQSNFRWTFRMMKETAVFVFYTK